MGYSEITKRTHWFVPKTELRQSVEDLKAQFTIRGRFKDSEPVPVYKETAKHFGIPLYYRDLSRHTDRLIDQTIKGGEVDVKFTATLRSRQEPIHDRFVQSIALGKHGVLLVAPTGTGKSVILLNFWAHLGRTALVVVPRDRIADQWVERIIEHTDTKPEEIGRAQGPVCDYEGKKIVIGTVQSLMRDKYPLEFKHWPGIIIYDEAHTMGAREFNKTISLFPAQYRIGASATPDRADGMEDAYKLHIGETVIEMKGATDVTPMVFLRGYADQKKHPYVHNVTDAKNRRGILLSHLAEDFRRTVLLAVYTKKFVKSDRRTLFLSDRTEQLNTMYNLLTKRHQMMPRKVGVFVGKTKKRERERVLNFCDVILATYGVMSMAIDVPDLRALVFGTPQSDVEQSLGRILRLCENTKDPVALDMIDQSYSDTRRWAYRRQQHYIKAGVKLINVK